MKIFIFFLPMVISFGYYNISNNKILICGNKTENSFNFNWYEAQSGTFKNLSMFQTKISIDSCPGIYYCQYEEMIADIEYSLHTTDLFVLNK